MAAGQLRHSYRPSDAPRLGGGPAWVATLRRRLSVGSRLLVELFDTGRAGPFHLGKRMDKRPRVLLACGRFSARTSGFNPYRMMLCLPSGNRLRCGIGQARSHRVASDEPGVVQARRHQDPQGRVALRPPRHRRPPLRQSAGGPARGARRRRCRRGSGPASGARVVRSKIGAQGLGFG